MRIRKRNGLVGNRRVLQTVLGGETIFGQTLADDLVNTYFFFSGIVFIATNGASA